MARVLAVKLGMLVIRHTSVVLDIISLGSMGWGCQCCHLVTVMKPSSGSKMVLSSGGGIGK